MANTRPTDEEIERDPFAEGVHSFILYVQKNYVMLIVVAVVLLVALLFWDSMRSKRERQIGALNSEINESIAQLDAIEAQTDPQQRVAQADALLAGISKVPATYPGIPLTNEAYYLKGRILFAVDRYKEAQESYQKFIEGASAAEDKARGEMAVGYSLENQAFMTTATAQQRDLLKSSYASYERAAQLLPDSYISAYAMMGQARTMEAQNEPANAIALYEQVVKSRPQADFVSPKPGDADKKESPVTRYLRMQMEQMDSQLSFQKTAELRLAALRGVNTSQTLSQAPAQ